MAARRLLIVMVVLLVISSLAAALVPPPDERTTSTSTAEGTREAPPPPEPPEGRRVEHRLDLAEKAPRKLRLAAGDQLALTVTSERFAQIAIPAYGLVDTATEGSPARFDVLIDEPRRFAIRLLEPPRELAQVVVSEPETGTEEGPDAPAETPEASSRSARSAER